MKIPKKLNPAPLLLSAINIKFDSDIPTDAVFGILYQNFQNELGTFKSFSMPIINIPLEIRENEDNLKFAPIYTLLDESKLYSIQIGGKVASIVYDKAYGVEYRGWKNYFKLEVEKFIECIDKSKIIKNIISLEYQNIDFFEHENIFENVNIKIDYPVKCISRQLSFSETFEGVTNNININGLAQAIVGNKNTSGSTIDIKTVYADSDISINNIKEMLGKMHESNKKLFFSIIKEDYINAKFSPEY
ncbi:MAG: TIGR04255 family protein [Campylobacter sp.]